MPYLIGRGERFLLRTAGCRIALWSTCLFFLAAPAFAQTAPHHSMIEGLVVGVSEGDRITVNSAGTEIPVRLYGLVAPKTAKLDKLTGWYKQGQPYAEDAYRALSVKVLHQQVKVEIRSSLTYKSDSEEAVVAVIYLDGRNINLEMINDGWAWVYRTLLSKIDYHRYSTAERIARSRKNGLWIQERPQPPWEFKPHLRVRAKQS